LQDGASTKRAIPRYLIQLKADFRLKPHLLVVNERDDRNWSIADKSGQMSNVVEGWLAS